ncbi:MAG TPA: YggT family protein [Gammaproteobacteria bacterium]
MSGNFAAAVLFLVNTLLSLYGMVVLLRFLLQLVRADFYNPLSQFVVRATNPLLRPLRRVVPGAWGIDFAALLLTYLVALVTVAALVAIAGASLPAPLLLGYALLKCILLLIHLYFFTILVQVILSWVSPGWSPVASMLHSLNEPLLRPFRRILPSLGGLDLSPLFAIILLQFVSFLIPLPGMLR